MKIPLKLAKNILQILEQHEMCIMKEEIGKELFSPKKIEERERLNYFKTEYYELKELIENEEWSKWAK